MGISAIAIGKLNKSHNILKLDDQEQERELQNIVALSTVSDISSSLSGSYSTINHKHSYVEISNAGSFISSDYTDISSNVNNTISVFTLSGFTEQDNKKIGDVRLMKFRATYEQETGKEPVYFYVISAMQ